MFYILSKIINILIDPLNLIAFLMVLGLGLRFIFKRFGNFVLGTGVALFLLLALPPCQG